MIFEKLKIRVPAGTVIEKPDSTALIVKWNDDTLTYEFGNNRRKSISREEIESSYDILSKTGKLTRQWFRSHFEKEHKNAPCNFTTIGGLFSHIGVAIKGPLRGVYLRVELKS